MAFNPEPARQIDQVSMHLEGTWVVFAVAACFIVYFVYRVTRAFTERDAEQARMQQISVRTEKLAALASLAAGAAHELSTPLSTIAVVAKEMERQLQRGKVSAQSMSDALLIREQVDRCPQHSGTDDRRCR